MASNLPASPIGTVAAPCRAGLLGWLWSLIGSNTPAYTGTGQPAPEQGWCGWMSTVPTYRVAPVEPAPTSAPPDSDGDQIEQGSGDGVHLSGTIAIVIRHD